MLVSLLDTNLYVCVYACICICIYIERERESERECVYACGLVPLCAFVRACASSFMCVRVCMCACVRLCFMYIYIYTYYSQSHNNYTCNHTRIIVFICTPQEEGGSGQPITATALSCSCNTRWEEGFLAAFTNCSPLVTGWGGCSFIYFLWCMVRGLGGVQ